MEIWVGPDDIEVHEPEVFTALSIRTLLDAGRTAQTLRDAGLARDGSADTAHVWIDVEALAKLAGRERDEGWLRSYRQMVSYAASRGWADAASSAVRVHLELVDD